MMKKDENTMVSAAPGRRRRIETGLHVTCSCKGAGALQVGLGWRVIHRKTHETNQKQPPKAPQGPKTARNRGNWGVLSLS